MRRGARWGFTMTFRSIALTALFLTACPDKEGDDSSSGDDSQAPEVEAVCTEPTEITCTDDIIVDLGLQTDISDGEVTTTTEGEDFYTFVDATAGGYNNASRNPWVYVKFSADGVTKVDIDDESALESMDWDMAFRRYIIRLNGGDSGPSCVGAAALLESAYADVTEVPDGLTYITDDYYTDDCSFVNDSSGLEGSPQTALSYWWEYPGCVATTNVPFLVQLADGHIMKFMVDTYYEENQESCNETGAPPADGGYIRFYWRMLK